MTESTAAPPPAGTGPLHGLRVVEAASMILVPAAAAMMADFGADVVLREIGYTDPEIAGLRAHGVIGRPVGG